MSWLLFSVEFQWQLLHNLMEHAKTIRIPYMKTIRFPYMKDPSNMKAPKESKLQVKGALRIRDCHNKREDGPPKPAELH